MNRAQKKIAFYTASILVVLFYFYYRIETRPRCVYAYYINKGFKNAIVVFEKEATLKNNSNLRPPLYKIYIDSLVNYVSAPFVEDEFELDIYLRNNSGEWIKQKKGFVQDSVLINVMYGKKVNVLVYNLGEVDPKVSFVNDQIALKLVN